MKIRVTYNVLHEFFTDVLHQKMLFEVFCVNFKDDRGFKEKVTARFEEFFFNLVEIGTIFILPNDHISISDGYSIKLRKAVRGENFAYQTEKLFVGSFELQMSQGRRLREMPNKSFKKEYVSFQYPDEWT